MKKTRWFTKGLLIIGLSSFQFSCSSSSEEEYKTVVISPVKVDLTTVPYEKLSDYNFFSGNIHNLTPEAGVIPYRPTSELFTDYAEKKRFIWLPPGKKATYVNDGSILNLPEGAALIKNFYYNKVQPNNSTVLIETRIMIRKSSGWIFAEYVWNEEQTEAYLQTNGSQKLISWKDESNIIRTVNYKIPSSDTDCKRCHGNINNNQVHPLAIKPQNLNSTFNYTTGNKNQLRKLIEVGYLENNLPNSIESVVDYKDTSKPLEIRVRSYFDSNCAHCHVDGGEADYFALRFAFNQTTVLENMGVSVQAQHQLAGYNGRIIYRGDYSQSILHYRINTETDNFYIMPPLGRSLKDEKATKLLEDWINTL